MTFVPFVLPIFAGETVKFPNLDTVKHQVYSFSPAKRFTLNLYGRDETRTVTFDKAGVVALGCNIHDSMIAFVKVSDTGLVAQSDDNGVLVLRDLPAGEVTIRLWHPYQRTPEGEQTITISMPSGGTVQRSATVNLRRPPMMPSY